MVNLISVAALLIFAAGGGQQGGPDVSVLSTRITIAGDYSVDARLKRSPARSTSVPQGHGETAAAFDALDDLADRSVGKKYRISVEVRNDSSVPVRSVTLAYQTGYTHKRKKPDRLVFKIRRKIEPGQALTLTRYFTSAKYVFRGPGRQATVESVEYEDGAVWRRH